MLKPKSSIFKLSKTVNSTIISLIGSIFAFVLLFRFINSTSNLFNFNSLFANNNNFFLNYNNYIPNFKNTPGVHFYDLNNYRGNSDGWQRNDRILFCVPLRDAAQHLPRFFNHLNTMTYPHNLIDLSFLVSDSKDDTMGVLLSHLQTAQSQQNKLKRFGNIEIYEKDFGQIIGQSFSDRHGFAAQGPRRKLMARARNWLGSVALKPYHSWVYWRDVDVETCPVTIMEDLMHHGKDVIVPNVWRPLPDWLGNIQPYDLNSWQESEGGLQLADSLDEDAVIVEGYPEYATWRPHLAYMRDPNGDPEEEMELDGIGGVSILSKAKVFRSGSHFPAFSFEKHAETEAFGKLSRRMNYNVVGLPHYVVWHIYEPSTEDLKHMAWMAEEEKRKLEESKIKEFYDKIWEIGFDDIRDDWRSERDSIFNKIDLSFKKPIGETDADDISDWYDDPEEKAAQAAHAQAQAAQAQAQAAQAQAQAAQAQAQQQPQQPAAPAQGAPAPAQVPIADVAAVAAVQPPAKPAQPAANPADNNVPLAAAAPIEDANQQQLQAAQQAAQQQQAAQIQDQQKPVDFNPDVN